MVPLLSVLRARVHTIRLVAYGGGGNHACNHRCPKYGTDPLYHVVHTYVYAVVGRGRVFVRKEESKEGLSLASVARTFRARVRKWYKRPGMHRVANWILKALCLC